jgi:hypothetical protein
MYFSNRFYNKGRAIAFDRKGGFDVPDKICCKLLISLLPRGTYGGLQIPVNVVEQANLKYCMKA